MTLQQLNVLMELHFKVDLVAAHYDNSRDLEVLYYDDGGNFHHLVIRSNGKFITKG